MDLTLKKNIKDLLKKHGTHAQKRLGQNFLINKGALRKIVEAAGLKSSDAVLEIGSGMGALTKELAKNSKEVVAVEKDLNLVRTLNEELRTENIKNVKVFQGDILKILNSKFLIPDSYKVVANLPYYITAPVIRRFLESLVQPETLVLVVQKEVGQRICAKPPRMNLLAVSVQFYAKPKIISFISKKSFWPQPKVDAAIIKITPEGRSKLNKEEFKDLFFNIVGAGFSQPRKQLINNLSKGLKIDKIKIESWLLKNNIQPQQRAETLNIENWVKLTKNFNIKR